MSDAFNESWTLLKFRRRADYDAEQIRRGLQEFVESVRGNDPIAMSHMAVNFERQMKYALDNDNYEMYEEIRDNAEEKVGRELANQASDNALNQHLAEQKEEQSGLYSVGDEYLRGIADELDEADIKYQREERPDEIIARHARDVEMAGGEPLRESERLANLAQDYEENFGYALRGDTYQNMRQQSLPTLQEMMIHHILTPFAPDMSLEEFQNEMSEQLGRSHMQRIARDAEDAIEDMSDVEREQRRRYAEAGGSPGAAGGVLGEFEDQMLNLMLGMTDPAQRDGSWNSNQLEETWLTVADLFGEDAANMMRERALEAHAEETRLPPGHPARILPVGVDRLPQSWKAGRSPDGKNITQIGLQEFDKNAHLTPNQRDDIRYLANLPPDDEAFRRRFPNQRTMANRRIEQRSPGSFYLVADDETGKPYTVSTLGTSIGGPEDMSLSDLNAATMKPFRRQGGYRDLLLALLNAGYDIRSDSRNREYSNPFHTNFMQTLPRGIDVSTNIYGSGDLSVEELQRRQAIIEAGGPLAQRYRRNRSDLSTLPVGPSDVIRYKREDMEGPPSWGDLRPDLGAIPIVRPAPKPAKEPYRGRNRMNVNIDNQHQTTFNLPSNTLAGVNRPSIEQRAMGMTYELPGTQGSVLRPKNQMEAIRYGYQPFAVGRNNVPFPAVGEQPTYSDVSHFIRPADFYTLYGSLPTHAEMDEFISTGQDLPPSLTQDQIDAIRQLAPLSQPSPRQPADFDSIAHIFD